MSTPRRNTCKPHRWRTPRPGDTALTCEACGRRLLRGDSITPTMRAAITKSAGSRIGESEAEEFHAFFGRDVAHESCSVCVGSRTSP